MIKRFTYNKNGELSERVVYVLKKPSDLLFGIDLSQFSPEEQKYYEKELDRLHAAFLEEIKEIGLNSCYRNFKSERIRES